MMCIQRSGAAALAGALVTATLLTFGAGIAQAGELCKQSCTPPGNGG